MAKVHSLKVGIDFGTTYSGVAWADSTTPDDINVIQDWPDGSNGTTDKVPTVIKYSKDYPAPGYKWGFQAELEPEKLVWIKLLLDPSHELFPAGLLVTSAALMPQGKEPVDLVTDYLLALKEHILSVFEDHYSEAFMKDTKIEYFLTVPAIWSDAARALTLQAAVSVGLGAKGTLPLITEPEAAAVFALKSMKHNLNVGDIFVIADCGGGTVDLISYEITALKPKLEVRGCVGGTGGMCGSTFINQAFEAWAKTRMGAQRFDSQSPMSRMDMNQNFENLKRNFSENDTGSFSCAVTGVANSPASGIKGGYLTITGTEMKAFFDPVISKVVNLVEQQIKSVEALNRKVSGVVLVGGFGASKYLRKRLKEVCDVKEIVLYNPKNAWTAVARGACQRGLEGLSIVCSHISIRSYGVLCARTIPNGSGDPENTYTCPHTKETKILNRVTWYIRKGDTITRDKVISSSFVCAVGLGHSMIFENTLLACRTHYTPKNARNRSVFTVCKLSTDLNVVPRHMFEDQKKLNADGVPYYLIQFELTIKIQTALMFSFVFKGKEYSSVIPEWSKGLNV